MKPTHAFLATLTILITLGIAVPANAQIQWAKSVDAALAKAKAENKVIFVALNMDGERANNQMVGEHYRDSEIQKLSRHTINMFCSNNVHKKTGNCTRCKGTTCAIHRDNDFQVRRKFLNVDGNEAIVAPQHLFVSPEGKIITSVSYFITKGELEWMFVNAIRELNPEFAWTPRGRSRAPEKYLKGGADKTKAEKPPTKEEVQKALKDIKKVAGARGGGRGGWREIIEAAQKNSRIVIRSDDKRALDWGQNTLRSYGRFRDGLIRDIGKVSPKPWSKVIEAYLTDTKDETRKTVAIALEQLANPKSVNPLRKAAKKEKEDDILGRMLRALAASGPGKSTAISTVTKAAKSHKKARVRAHAIVGVGKIEKREAVTTSLRVGLQDEDALVRTVTAYVIAIRQDKSLLDHLVASLQAETEDSVKAWFEKAINAVKSGDTKAFKNFLPKILDGNEPGSEIDRLREMAEDFDRGDGGKKDGEDKDKDKKGKDGDKKKEKK